MKPSEKCRPCFEDGDSDSLFHLTDETHELPTRATFQLDLQADHPIFRAHFPGHPILPGVCALQIVKELAERTWKSPLRLSEAKNIKYLAPISPSEVSTLTIDLSGEPSQLKATLSQGDTTFAKLSLRFCSLS